jgi:hypothetical protein
MTDLIFTRPHAWVGGFYELSIPLGSRDDARLMRAREAVWSFPDLDGCYLHRDREPSEQARVPVASIELETKLYGVARLGLRGHVACATFVVRYEDGEDWLWLSIPLGSLATVLPVRAFPFDNGNDLAWRSELDEWLCAIGRRVFEAVPFRLALVGFDASEDDDAATFARSGVPEERWVGFLALADDELRWFPPNRGASLTVQVPPRTR